MTYDDSPMPRDGPDEETALLHKAKKQRTPLPMAQISILLFLQLSEPITSGCIFPFINQLVRELDITDGDEASVGYYAGLVISLFYMAEAVTVLQWSRLSDHIGRKPVLLTGLTGLCLSMLCFGFSRTFLTIAISRCLAGATNGNIGVLKSMMGELTDSTNITQGFALIPIVWSIGATIGPFLGGTLANPHEHYPKMFGHPFWAKYPYMLPCAVAASVSATSFFVTLFFLKETVQKDNVLEKPPPSPTTDGDMCEPSYGAPDKPQPDNRPVPLRQLFVFPILISVSNYCFLAFLEIAFAALLLLFYSSPIEFGGLGLSPSVIGICLGMYGLANGVFQVLFFAKIVARLGPKRAVLLGITFLFPMFLIFPISNYFAGRWGLSPAVWALVVLQLCVYVLLDVSFGCIFIFVTASAPNRRSLGATNGLAQATVSFSRAVGPAASTSLFAYSREHNLLGGNAVYAIFALLSCASLVLALWLPGGWTWDDEE